MPQLLDVAIGTIFVFLLFSLVVSALNEYILTLTDQRAKFLRLGLARMFGVGIVKTWKGKYISGGLLGGDKESLGEQGDKLLSHGLINAFSRSNKANGTGTPSYIPAGAFVTGLLDVIVKPEPSEKWSAEHVKMLSDFITEIKNANPAEVDSCSTLLANFKTAYSLLTPPEAGSVLEKIYVRVNAAADKLQLQTQLSKVADFAAAKQLIDQSATLKAELDPLTIGAKGDFKVLKSSIEQWFTPRAELAALEAEAAAAITAYFYSAAQQTSAAIRAGIQSLPPGKLKSSLQSLFQTVEGDVQKFKLAVEGWFNGVMDRVSGWYKRFAQKWMIVIGFLLAATFNVDTLEIVRVLSNNPNLAKAVANQGAAYMEENKDNHPLTAKELAEQQQQQLKAVAEASVALDKQKRVTASAETDASDPNAAIQAQTKAKAILTTALADQKNAEETLAKAIINADPQAKFKAAVAQLQDTGIPMGWTPEVLKKLGVERSPDGVLSVPKEFQDRVLIGMIGGWFLTAIAASLGAPFWFDLLGRFVNVRASGKVPGEKETTSSPTRPPPANIDTTPGTHAPAN